MVRFDHSVVPHPFRPCRAVSVGHARVPVAIVDDLANRRLGGRREVRGKWILSRRAREMSRPTDDAQFGDETRVGVTRQVGPRGRVVDLVAARRPFERLLDHL
jgi:hypothetical protein